jgi:hypothetical protein
MSSFGTLAILPTGLFAVIFASHKLSVLWAEGNAIVSIEGKVIHAIIPTIYGTSFRRLTIDSFFLN